MIMSYMSVRMCHVVERIQQTGCEIAEGMPSDKINMMISRKKRKEIERQRGSRGTDGNDEDYIVDDEIKETSKKKWIYGSQKRLQSRGKVTRYQDQAPYQYKKTKQ